MLKADDSMKAQSEIDRAHSLLSCVKVGLYPMEMVVGDYLRLSVAVDVLCWVLGHKHDTDMQVVLTAIEAAMRKDKIDVDAMLAELAAFKATAHDTIERDDDSSNQHKRGGNGPRYN